MSGEPQNFTIKSVFKVFLPCTCSHWRFQRAGIADHFVQNGDYLVEFGPVSSLLLPAVQHELVESWRAVHGGRKTVALLDRLDDLEVKKDVISIRVKPRAGLRVGFGAEVRNIVLDQEKLAATL